MQGSIIGGSVLAMLALMGCGAPPSVGDVSQATSVTSDAPRPASAAVRPETRTLRDWYATCDNGNDCFAYTGTDTGGWLLVRLGAGPEAVPTILVGVSPFADEAPGETVRLTIDDVSEVLAAGPDESASHAVSSDRVAATLVRLASARSLSIGKGEAETSLPTAGASAALLWIDERQGRLDTTSALIRRGDRPASTVPSAPALPRVVRAATPDQGRFARASDPGEQGSEANLSLPAAIEALPEVRQCREDTAFNAFLQKAVLAARLSPDTELWGVPCDAGAYNAMYDFYLTGTDGSNPRKADFPSWEPRERTEGDIAGDGLVNPVFDANTNTLRHFPRARGIGDCGTIQSWGWTGEAFVLVQERFMGNCWGMPSNLWPTIWRTQ